MYTDRASHTVATTSVRAGSGFVEVAILSLGGLAVTLLMIALGYFSDAGQLLGP